MSASVYANLRATAQRLLNGYGTPITYKVTGTTPPDAAKPWQVNTADVSYPFNAVKEPVLLSQVDGQTIHAADIWYLIAAPFLPVAPKAGDQITDGSKTLTVQRVEQVGSDAVVYNCLARA